jgi:branched-chain amino acid transport system ATP-binding protein
MSIIRLEHVTKNFGGFVALKDVNLKLSQGEILGLIGPNGSGKTTLLNIIGGFYAPNNGKVFYKEKDVTGLPSFRLARMGIAKTFQITRPFSRLSILDNAMIGAIMKENDVSNARKKAIEVLTRVGFKQSELHSPSEKATTPQRKKLEIARALCMEPEVLLLDEVMVGSTPSEIDELLKIISDLRMSRGVSIIIIEHILKAIMSITDRVVVLDAGIRIAEGTPQAIAANELVKEVFIGKEIA